jgi:beta-aspartyl-peptidase (threonine type)
VHGGAGPDSPFIQEHVVPIEEGIRHAVETGYALLEKGATAITAVEAAVAILEDDPHFNAGRGSSLNVKGGIEMDAAIMDGDSLSAGAVAGLQWVRNPVSLARAIMEKTAHVLMNGHEALELARKWKLKMEKASYFITSHQYETFLKHQQQRPGLPQILWQKKHGTVGAVVIDNFGNLAAATSTGGTENALPGRIGDSCIIGAGCYANNKNCAVSATGDGEMLITRVVAHSIACQLKIMGNDLQGVCEQIIHPEDKLPGDAGVISIDKNGYAGISFNTARMPRGWKFSDGATGAAIYK